MHTGQISPSHAQRDVRSHPLNPFSRQSLNPDGSLTDLSGLTKEEQEAAHQLDSCVHGELSMHNVQSVYGVQGEWSAHGELSVPSGQSMHGEQGAWCREHAGGLASLGSSVLQKCE
eukprot:1157313-Pelagomonas_calceolata.AAC.9